MPAHRSTVLLALCLVSAGCSSTEITGTATTPAGSAATTTAVAPAKPTSLPPKDVGTVLLKRNELGDIVGAPDIKQETSFTDTVRETGVEPVYACPGRFFAGASSAFYSSSDNSRRAMEGNGNAAGIRYAAQVVAVFDTRRSVDSAMSGASMEWRLGCPDGQKLTITGGDDNVQTWTAGPVQPPVDSWTNPNDIDRMSTTVRRQLPTPKTCAAVIAAQGTALVESIVCGPDDAAAVAQAGVIVDRIVAKLPK